MTNEEPTAPSRPDITIYVDADACPVKDEVYKVAMRYQLPVRVVANTWIQTPATDRVMPVVVSEGPDAADDWIAERVDGWSLVVTADIPLAARCLERGATVLGHRGREFTTASIGDALASRELSADLREMGIMGKGAAPFGKADRSRFLGKLDELVHRVRRRAR
jgi:uncharacterized protein YaiI (UPF0178 family)